jgi:hypothetical protein
MRINKNITKRSLLSLVIAASLGLAGCGGDGTERINRAIGVDDANGTGISGANGSDGNINEVNITAVDGYIVGAQVTDAQGNVAFSNGDGTYSFIKIPIYPISLNGGILLDTENEFNGDIIVGNGDADMYAVSGSVISPITTLLATITNNKVTDELNTALSVKLASIMGMSEAELLTDFVANENLVLAKITQVIHLMEQEPTLFATFKEDLLAESGTSFAGVKASAVSAMTTVNVAGALSDTKQTVYTQIISDVETYASTAGGLEVAINSSKAMLENIALIESIGADIGDNLALLQTANALAEMAGSGDSALTLTAAQLTNFGINSIITDSETLTALMVDVIRQTGSVTGNRLDSVAELWAIEDNLIDFYAVDTQQGSAVTDIQLLAAYNTILGANIAATDYRVVLLAALTNSDAAVTATTVAEVQALFDSVPTIDAPVVTVTIRFLKENSGRGQTIATATTLAGSGSALTADSYALGAKGDTAIVGTVVLAFAPSYVARPSVALEHSRHR